ncbi:uncharacterized protein LOC106641358 [Copidosoma floridanum]|uniref:uncharacterized protein LOC106641358 n=1 Tax=Copidosoma floridanum TaxID=29053 RepID=UPI0006C994D4|nr:uncharacterized protein LOC106641358 [Copidosoma floridanum]
MSRDTSQKSIIRLQLKPLVNLIFAKNKHTSQLISIANNINSFWITVQSDGYEIRTSFGFNYEKMERVAERGSPPAASPAASRALAFDKIVQVVQENKRKGK